MRNIPGPDATPRKSWFVLPSLSGPALGVLLSACFVAGASAQTPPPGSPGVPPEVMEPPSENPTPPADPSTDGAEPTKPLTEKLREGEGVIEPPRGIDPEIKQPVPEDFKSKTPVIPPPGDSDGAPDIEPK